MDINILESLVRTKLVSKTLASKLVYVVRCYFPTDSHSQMVKGMYKRLDEESRKRVEDRHHFHLFPAGMLRMPTRELAGYKFTTEASNPLSYIRRSDYDGGYVTGIYDMSGDLLRLIECLNDGSIKELPIKTV